MGQRIRCSAKNPCPICGSRDYDMAVDYGNGDIVYWCHKSAGIENVLIAGQEYVCIKEGKEISIGVFNLYRRKDMIDRDREQWVEEQQKNNPDWQPHRFGTKKSETASQAPYQPTFEVVEDVKPLSNKELDLRYRYFLSLLVLEKKHKEKLYEEWNSQVYPNLADTLLKEYPIRSLPPEDRIRYAGTEKFDNPTRKRIVKKMQERFGTCIGIPGFFKRAGDYWANKPEAERETFSRGEGIIFPVYDVDGYLYRLRFRDDYHSMQLKKTDSSRFMGDTGTFVHSYGTEGEHLWKFYPDTKGSSPHIVYSPDANQVELSKWGVPKIGHATNKYKTLSSWSDKVDGNVIRNALDGGCRSGSPYSLYVPNNCSNFTVVIGTEGEKKGMVASQIKGVPLITLPGVGTWPQLFDSSGKEKSVFDCLKEKGMKIFVLAYDADKSENLMVANAERDFVQKVREEGVRPFIANWNGKFDKGLDDILLMGIDFLLDDPFQKK